MKTTLITAATALLMTLSVLAQDATGTWSKKANAIKGSWKIENHQLALEGFSTKGAPDLKIFLSPLSASELNNKNATKGAKLVAKLKSPKGNQAYALPKDLDLSKYKTILIHCEKYSKLWSVSSLSK